MERLFRNDYDKHLFRLHELQNFKVAENEPDIRGWRVIGQDGDVLGWVKEIIVDPSQKKVRYIDVNLEQKLIAERGESHILIPVGVTRLHDTSDAILLEGISTEKLKSCPVLKNDTITRDYEQSLTESLSSRPGNYKSDNKLNKNYLYDNEIFDDEPFFLSIKKRMN